MKLSILLCSLPIRLKSFSTIEELSRQAEEKDVEILYLGDNQKMSVGEKRNKLLDLAKGEYICFVDDDDRVEHNYIDSILNAINSNNVDCINFLASVRLNNGPAKLCYYSNLFQNVNLEDRYLRQPNHLMVWRKTILSRFPEINIGEDNAFGSDMANKTYTEYCIDSVLYHYDFNSLTTIAQK